MPPQRKSKIKNRRAAPYTVFRNIRETDEYIINLTRDMSSEASKILEQGFTSSRKEAYEQTILQLYNMLKTYTHLPRKINDQYNLLSEVTSDAEPIGELQSLIDTIRDDIEYMKILYLELIARTFADAYEEFNNKFFYYESEKLFDIVKIKSQQFVERKRFKERSKKDDDIDDLITGFGSIW
jgi:hypothetical protein